MNVVSSKNNIVKNVNPLKLWQNDLPAIFCVLKKKKNNFFVTVMKLNGEEVLFSKSCGSLAGVRGSKKYTTVSLESLGKETFFHLFSLGYRNFDFSLLLRFKVDKFVRSFIRGVMLYGKNYINISFKVQLLHTHNGLRSRKQRRV